MQIPEEIGEISDIEDQLQMNNVNYVVRYLVKNGEDMSDEMTDLAIGVCSGITQNSAGVTKISAMQVMAICLAHRGQLSYAAQYSQMIEDEVEKVQHYELSGIEYG